MDKNMQGKIVKGISGFYYVHVAGSGIYECKAKGIFRNQKIKPLVGDNVTIAVLDEEQMLGNIEEILGPEWLNTDMFRIGASSAANNLLSAIEGREIKYY